MGNYTFRPCPTVPLTPGTSHVERLLVSAWGINKAVLGGDLWFMSLCSLLTFMESLALLSTSVQPPIEALFSCGLPSVLPATLGMTKTATQPQISPNCSPGSGKQEMGVGRH